MTKTLSRFSIVAAALALLALEPAYAQNFAGGNVSLTGTPTGSGQCPTSIAAGSNRAAWGSCGGGSLPGEVDGYGIIGVSGSWAAAQIWDTSSETITTKSTDTNANIAVGTTYINGSGVAQWEPINLPCFSTDANGFEQLHVGLRHKFEVLATNGSSPTVVFCDTNTDGSHGRAILTTGQWPDAPGNFGMFNLITHPTAPTSANQVALDFDGAVLTVIWNGQEWIVDDDYACQDQQFNDDVCIASSSPVPIPNSGADFNLSPVQQSFGCLTAIAAGCPGGIGPQPPISYVLLTTNGNVSPDATIDPASWGNWINLTTSNAGSLGLPVGWWGYWLSTDGNTTSPEMVNMPPADYTADGMSFQLYGTGFSPSNTGVIGINLSGPDFCVVAGDGSALSALTMGHASHNPEIVIQHLGWGCPSGVTPAYRVMDYHQNVTITGTNPSIVAHTGTATPTISGSDGAFHINYGSGTTTDITIQLSNCNHQLPTEPVISTSNSVGSTPAVAWLANEPSTGINYCQLKLSNLGSLGGGELSVSTTFPYFN